MKTTFRIHTLFFICICSILLWTCKDKTKKSGDAAGSHTPTDVSFDKFLDTTLKEAACSDIKADPLVMVESKSDLEIQDAKVVCINTGGKGKSLCACTDSKKAK